MQQQTLITDPADVADQQEAELNEALGCLPAYHAWNRDMTQHWFGWPVGPDHHLAATGLPGDICIFIEKRIANFTTEIIEQHSFGSDFPAAKAKLLALYEPRREAALQERKRRGIRE